jgi:hypothetical protein
MKFPFKNQFLFCIILIELFSCINYKKHETSTDIYKSYANEKGNAFFTLPPGLVSVFLDENQVGNKELKSLLEDTNKLSFLIINNINESKESLTLKDITKRLEAINFQDLVMVNSGNEIVRVKIQREDQAINEMVVLVSNKDAIYCVSFNGKISIDKIVDLNQPQNFVAVSNLNKFKR